MNLTRLSDHCWTLPFSTYADRPALGCVCGTHDTLRVEAGNGPVHYAIMEELMQRASLPKTTLLAVTHSHWDHTFGMCAAGVPVYANRPTQAQLERMSRWTWTLEAMEERLRAREDIAFCHNEMLVEYPDPAAIRVRAADVVYDGRMELDLGGVSAQLLHWPSSHSADHSVIYVPEDGVLFLGDICYTDLHHEPECLHRRRFLQLMEQIRACDFSIAVPGHQLAMSKAELLLDMEEQLNSPDCPVYDD